jgi:hypothetical protein
MALKPEQLPCAADMDGMGHWGPMAICGEPHYTHVWLQNKGTWVPVCEWHYRNLDPEVRRAQPRKQ